MKRTSPSLPSSAEPGSRRDTLLVRWRAKDTPMGVTRDTVRKLSAHFGVTETALIHLALRGLANDVWPVEELRASQRILDREHRVSSRPLAGGSKPGRRQPGVSP